MKNRRELLMDMGLGTALLMTAPYLQGCADPHTNPVHQLDWRPLDHPPVLPGHPDTAWWLRGNYGPIENEIEAYNLEVLGSIPPELNGTFVRNGPNPFDEPSDIGSSVMGCCIP